MFKVNDNLIKGNTSPKIVLSKVEIQFRNGYSTDSPKFTALCSLSIGTGKEEWGAEPGKEYYILEIHEITYR